MEMTRRTATHSFKLSFNGCVCPSEIVCEDFQKVNDIQGLVLRRWMLSSRTFGGGGLERNPLSKGESTVTTKYIKLLIKIGAL